MIWVEARLLGLPTARLGSAIAGITFGVAVIAGALRVLPVMLAPGVPLALAAPLARGVVEVGLEIALFLALPIASALAAARLVDRGDARALAALGVSPRRIAAGVAPIAAILALAAGIASFAWGRDAAAPGRVARDLLAEARVACASAPPPAAADVPLIGLSWVCLPGEPPRVVGVAPLGSAPVYFSATEIDLADDLRTLRLRGLELIASDRSSSGSKRDARVEAGEASIEGLIPLGRASNLAPSARAALFGTAAFVLGLFAAFVVIRGAIRSPGAAIAIGILGPAAALALFGAFERTPTNPALYLLVPLAGVAATSLALVRRRATAFLRG